MKNLIQRGRLFFATGFISGLGFGLFAVEAFRPEKRPFFYLGAIALTLVGTILFRHLRKSETSSPDHHNQPMETTLNQMSRREGD
jgi:hypothetical protein